MSSCMEGIVVPMPSNAFKVERVIEEMPRALKYKKVIIAG